MAKHKAFDDFEPEQLKILEEIEKRDGKRVADSLRVLGKTNPGAFASNLSIKSRQYQEDDLAAGSSQGQPVRLYGGFTEAQLLERIQKEDADKFDIVMKAKKLAEDTKSPKLYENQLQRFGANYKSDDDNLAVDARNASRARELTDKVVAAARNPAETKNIRSILATGGRPAKDDSHIKDIPREVYDADPAKARQEDKPAGAPVQLSDNAQRELAEFRDALGVDNGPPVPPAYKPKQPSSKDLPEVAAEAQAASGASVRAEEGNTEIFPKPAGEGMSQDEIVDAIAENLSVDLPEAPAQTETPAADAENPPVPVILVGTLPPEKVEGGGAPQNLDGTPEGGLRLTEESPNAPNLEERVGKLEISVEGIGKETKEGRAYTEKEVNELRVYADRAAKQAGEEATRHSIKLVEKLAGENADQIIDAERRMQGAVRAGVEEVKTAAAGEVDSFEGRNGPVIEELKGDLEARRKAGITSYTGRRGNGVGLALTVGLLTLAGATIGLFAGRGGGCKDKEEPKTDSNVIQLAQTVGVQGEKIENLEKIADKIDNKVTAQGNQYITLNDSYVALKASLEQNAADYKQGILSVRKELGDRIAEKGEEIKNSLKADYEKVRKTMEDKANQNEENERKARELAQSDLEQKLAEANAQLEQKMKNLPVVIEAPKTAEKKSNWDTEIYVVAGERVSIYGPGDGKPKPTPFGEIGVQEWYRDEFGAELGLDYSHYSDSSSTAIGNAKLTQDEVGLTLEALYRQPFSRRFAMNLGIGMRLAHRDSRMNGTIFGNGVSNDSSEVVVQGVGSADMKYKLSKNVTFDGGVKALLGSKDGEFRGFVGLTFYH